MLPRALQRYFYSRNDEFAIFPLKVLTLCM